MSFGIADLILDAKFPDASHKLVALAFTTGPVRMVGHYEFSEADKVRWARIANTSPPEAECIVLLFIAFGILDMDGELVFLHEGRLRALAAGRMSWVFEPHPYDGKPEWTLDGVDDELDGQPRKRPIPAMYRLKVFARDGYKCRQCGSSDGLSCDHIFPESKGGRLELSNLQTLCRSCNSKKGATVPFGAQP